ncbi:hypothetical protein T439DRAFT_295613 [Meredithblackwellia eburnea MCA 4105]
MSGRQQDYDYHQQQQYRGQQQPPVAPPRDQRRQGSVSAASTRGPPLQDGGRVDPRRTGGSSGSVRYHEQQQKQQQSNGSSTKQDWAADEPAMLALYGLSTLSPTEWQDTTSGDDGGAGGGTSPRLDTSGASTAAAAAASRKGDENDPLGLMRGGVLAANPDLPSEIRSAILLHSKAFDPKVFLSTVHPNASFQDLNIGRDRLKDSLEQRSGALQLLVQAEWDRFVGVKGATESVYEEMKQGPLAPGQEHGVKEVRETLRQGASRADAVFQPILDARTKAERLKSTLGVFERSKFFFNLPGILGEAVEAGKYDVALQAYKKGRYILASRPAQLLGLPVATTAQQQQQQKRIYDKVWGQVEKIIGDLRATLGKRLRDTKRGLDEVEKTIEILLELDPTDDPVWIFFDTQHRHILHLLRTSADASSSRIRIAMDQLPEESLEDRKMAQDLRAGVASLESLEGERMRENGAGHDIWILIFNLVRNLSEVIMQTLPSFWKVAKGYMEGKYQKKNGSSAPSGGSRRSPTQCRVMTQDIVTLYVSLLSQFFSLSSSTHSPPPAAGAPSASDPNAPIVLPSFVPPNSNAPTICHWLLKILAELTECINEVGALELAGEASASLKELVASTRWRFEEATCAAWVRDAKVFYRLETWRPDPDEPSTTLYLRQLAAFQRFCTISAYRLAGGSEERANAALASASGSTLSGRSRQEGEISSEFGRKIKAAFLDGLYAFLDGLVHVAFSDPDTIFINGKSAPRRVDAITRGEDGRPKEVDVSNVDVRILLTVSNLSHLRSTTIPRMINQFQAAFKEDMPQDVHMLMEVINQLDGILFDDYVKRKSSEVAKIIKKGVLGGTVNWYEAPKPTEVHPFIYDALLSLVLVHAQVSETARPLVARTLGALVEELAKVALEAFSKVERFGMGGMLQATLEIEFMHQTLSQHVSQLADETLQSIYRTISQAYYRRPTPNSSNELQQELEALKRTLVASRRATALQFLAFRKVRERNPESDSTDAKKQAAKEPSAADERKQ